uniref:Uncharacterized protein n=1 Tax=Vitis vinifera TaxID=29760 RepID=F6I2Q5_VITVI
MKRLFLFLDNIPG